MPLNCSYLVSLELGFVHNLYINLGSPLILSFEYFVQCLYYFADIGFATVNIDGIEYMIYVNLM